MTNVEERDGGFTNSVTVKAAIDAGDIAHARRLLDALGTKLPGEAPSATANAEQ